MNKWLIPLRSGGIILLAEISFILISQKSFYEIYISLPYIVGVALGFVAIEYIRIYKVKVPIRNIRGFVPLVWA